MVYEFKVGINVKDARVSTFIFMRNPPYTTSIYLNWLISMRRHVIIIEYQIIHLSDVIVLSFRDLVFKYCSLEFLNRIFIVTYVIHQVVFLASLDVTVSI